MRAELLGEALGQADHAPLGGGIGRAEGVAEPAGGRGHVDDGPAAGGLEQRHGAARAQELAGEVDLEAAAPVGGVDVLDRLRSGPAMPALLTSTSSPPSRARTSSNSRSTSASSETSARVCETLGRAAATSAERRLVHVAQMHPRTRRDQRLDDRPPDAGGTRGHQHPLALGHSDRSLAPPNPTRPQIATVDARSQPDGFKPTD